MTAKIIVDVRVENKKTGKIESECLGLVYDSSPYTVAVHNALELSRVLGPDCSVTIKPQTKE